MSNSIKLRCKKCRVANNPEDMIEKESDDGYDVIDMLCPECHGTKFHKVPPQRA